MVGEPHTPEAAKPTSKRESKPKEHRFKQGGKRIKGYYYHAAEYQRKKQQERGFLGKMGHGFIEFAMIQVRQGRLRNAVRRYRETTGQDPILTDAFVKQILDSRGKLDDKTLSASRAAGKAHETLLRVVTSEGQEKREMDKISPAEQQRASGLLQEILNAKGALSEGQLDQLAKSSNIPKEEIKNLASQVMEVMSHSESMGVKFRTPDEMKQAVTDQLLFAGLTPDQVKQAKRVAFHSAFMTTFGVARIVAVPVAGHFIALNVLGSAVLGAAAGVPGRFTTLKVQESVYGTNKERGVVAQVDRRDPSKFEKWLARRKTLAALSRLMSVDFEEKEGKNLALQYGRALLAGAALGMVLKFAPDVAQAAEHIVGGIADNIQHTNFADSLTAAINVHDPNVASEIFSYISHHGGKLPEGYHYGTGAHSHDLYTKENTLVLKNVRYDSARHQYMYDVADKKSVVAADQTGQFTTETHQVAINQIGVNNYHADAWSGAQHGATWAYDVHNTWTTDSMKFNIYDHADLKNGINYFALHMPNNQTAIIDLAHSSVHHHDGEYSFTFDKNDTHDTFALMDTNGHQIGTITSSEAFKLFNHTDPTTDHLAPSTGASSDFAVATQDNIRSMIDFGNYKAGANGALDFTRYGQVQGHGGFGNLHELSLTQHVAAPVAAPSPLAGDNDNFHSVIAPGITHVDNGEDRGLEWLSQVIHNDAVANKLDQVTDFGLNNMDRLALLTQGHVPEQVLERPYLLYSAISAPYVASGVAGYFYGRNHAQKNPSALNKTGGIATETALAFVNPGMAATAGVGFLIGRFTGKKGEKKTKKDNSKEAETVKPTSPQSPSGNPPADDTAAAVAKTEPEKAEALPAEQPVDPILSAPPAPPPPADGVDSTQEGAQIGRLIPDGPTTAEGAAPAAGRTGELPQEALTSTIKASPFLMSIPAFKEVADYTGPEALAAMQKLFDGSKLPTVIADILKPLGLSDEKVHEVVEQIQERLRSHEGFKMKDLLLLGGLAGVVEELAKKGVTPEQIQEVLRYLGKAIVTEEGMKKIALTAIEGISQLPGFEALGAFLTKEGSAIIPALESLAPALEEAAPVLAA